MYKSICFRDATIDILRVDPGATAGGRHIRALIGSVVLLLQYKHARGGITRSIVMHTQDIRQNIYNKGNNTYIIPALHTK